MSHLLKRTKKSCLKLLRKISTSKQLFAQKLEEDDISTCNISPSSVFDEEPEKQNEPELNIKTVQYTETESDVESQQLSFGDNQNSAITQGLTLTSKFFLGADGYEFQRLQQLRSDVASEVLEFDAEFINSVQFDRVPFRENVRYLRHTPSSSSLELNAKTEASISPLRQLSLPSNNKLNMKIYHNPNGTPTRGLRPCAKSVSVGAKFDGSYHNAIITEEQSCNQSPVIKWDINGNSLDDDDVFALNNRWEDFDSRWNQLQDKRLTKLNADHSQLSSHQSSSCTLETWLDDENLENYCVFNDKTALHNCNLCLKSL